MPTENRSSNTEMVSFPRELSDELAELIAHRARVCGGGAFEIWEAICEEFGQPAEHQGEPVAYLQRRALECLAQPHIAGCAASLEKSPRADFVAVYTHPAPAGSGEVERLREENRVLQKQLGERWADVDELRAQLAERDELLEEAYRDGWNDGQEAIEQRYQSTPRSSTEGWERFKADNAISASAEPSAPVERDERALPGWLTVDAERVIVRLSRPSEANGVQVDSLSLRAPTVRDICNATVGGAGDDAQSELNLFASLAEVGVKDLEGLALKDYSRLQTGYFHLVQDDYRAALEHTP